MGRKTKHRMLRAAAASFCLAVLCLPAAAEVYTGTGYTYDDLGKAIPAPASHTVTQVLYGTDMGAGALNDPQDLFIDADGAVIADTGNDRVLLLDTAFRLQREVRSVTVDGEESALSQPMGVCRGPNGSLYICDSGNARVLRLDSELNVTFVYGKPDTELLEKDFLFRPEKVGADSAGSVYITANGLYQGLIEYDAEGGFAGFFGSNRVELTPEVLLSYYWKKLLTREQGEAMTRLIPVQYANLCVDENGFVWAVTAENDTSKNEVKKLNASGGNALHFSSAALYDHSDFGDLEQSNEKGVQIDSSIIDVTVEQNGTFSLLDLRRGKVFQYDKNCRLLFVFGGLGTQRGTFARPAALAVRNGQYAVLDAEKGSVTLFEKNAYAQKLTAAVDAYNSGRSAEVTALWRELLSENSHLSIAWCGLGKASMRAGDYPEAMRCFKLGNDHESYSEALREYRRESVRSHAWQIAAAVVLLIAAGPAVRIIKKAVRRRKGG